MVHSSQKGTEIREAPHHHLPCLRPFVKNAPVKAERCVPSPPDLSSHGATLRMLRRDPTLAGEVVSFGSGG